VHKKPRILAFLAISVLAFTAPTALAEVKIAVVDVQNAILQSEEAKRHMKQIQEEFKEDEEEIRNIQTEAAAMLERARKDADVMSDPEKRRLSQRIDEKNNDFVYKRQKMQRKIEERQKELFAGIDAKVKKAIEDLILKDDYDIVLPRQTVWYVGDLYNITRRVTEKLNEFDAAAKK